MGNVYTLLREGENVISLSDLITMILFFILSVQMSCLEVAKETGWLAGSSPSDWG